jgi:hypothetical protein
MDKMDFYKQFISKQMDEQSIDQEERQLEEEINEVLKQSAPAGTWIRDFIDSDNPKFKGKSKKERMKMALGAYYAAHPEKSNK